VGVPAGDGTKAKALIIFFDTAFCRTKFPWPYRHSAVF
jgi:hypothetical protein